DRGGGGGGARDRERARPAARDRHRDGEEARARAADARLVPPRQRALRSVEPARRDAGGGGGDTRVRVAGRAGHAVPDDVPAGRIRAGRAGLGGVPELRTEPRRARKPGSEERRGKLLAVTDRGATKETGSAAGAATGAVRGHPP